MLTRKMTDALNKHINRELHSAYIYMSMSAHCSFTGLKGFATWFMVQYHEEMLHAMKLYEYVVNQGARVELLPVEEPLKNFKSPIDIFEKTLKHEQFMTKNINALVDLAIAEKDHATQIFMHWYVTEQVEEEDNVNDILNKLKLIGKDSSALLTLDKELSARTLTVPTDFSRGVKAAMGAAAA